MKTQMAQKILVMIFAVMCGGCAAFSFSDTVPNAFRARTDTDPAGPSTSSSTTRELGDVVIAADIDQDGCAVESVTRLNETDPVYIVLEPSAFPQGTTFFARLYDETRALEDTAELTADQAYDNVCVNFIFESEDGWADGAYQIEMFVNGNSYQMVDFNVR